MSERPRAEIGGVLHELIGPGDWRPIGRDTAPGPTPEGGALEQQVGAPSAFTTNGHSQGIAPPTREEIISAAEVHLARGWSVGAIHPFSGIGSMAQCRCGLAHCKSPGKHGNVKHADRRLSRLELRLNAMTDGAGLFVATGAASGITVIDLDVKNDGEWEFGQWLAGADIELPHTLTQTTATGGKHLVFEYVEGVKNLNQWLPGVDVKNDGGYIVAAPSLHICGARYAGFDDTPIAAMPDGLQEALRNVKSRRARTKATTNVVPIDGYQEAKKTGPKKGERDGFFNAYAFELRRTNTSYDVAARMMWDRLQETEQAPGDAWTWDMVEEKLRRVWAEVEPEVIPDWMPATGEKRQRSDDGNALRFADALHGELRYSPQRERWLAYRDGRWQWDRRNRPIAAARDVARGLLKEASDVEDDTERQLAVKWAAASQGRTRIEAMVSLAKSDPRLVVELSQLDADPWLLNTPSGTFNLRADAPEFRPHRPADLITKMTRFPYIEGVECPAWERFVSQVMGGDAEMVAYLQRVLGYAITGDTSEQAWFFLFGRGGNGKSTLINVVRQVVSAGDDDYGHHADSELLLATRWGADRSSLANLKGRRLVSIVETQRDRTFNEAIIKQLTGGDPLTARRLYENEVTFNPELKLVFLANDKPTVRDSTHGMWRRMHLIPFEQRFTGPDGARDRTLEEKLLATEGPGILRWLVNGAYFWQKVGLSPPQRVLDAVAEYQDEQDQSGDFFEDRCEFGSGLKTPWTELWAAYESWCFAQGTDRRKRETQGSFREQLKDRGCEPGKSMGVRLWKGVGLVASSESIYGLPR